MPAETQAAAALVTGVFTGGEGADEADADFPVVAEWRDDRLDGGQMIVFERDVAK